MPTGTARFLSVDKGYGCTKPDNGGRDIFAIELDRKDKGPKAIGLACA